MSAYELWIAYQTILVKEIRRFIRIWGQTLLPPAITMTLYFVIFGNLIGPRIGKMGGHSYMSFIVPGLVMMAVITSSYANVVSSFFGTKFQKSIEELLVAPVPSWIVLLGYVSGGVARGILVGFIVLLVSLGFTHLHIHSPLVMLSVIILTAVLFSLGGFINALFATKFDDISIVPTFILTPLTYLGGVFYSINLLPEFWQWVSKINPIFYMVNALRYGILGVSDVNISISFVMIIGFIIALASSSLYFLNRGRGIRH